MAARRLQIHYCYVILHLQLYTSCWLMWHSEATDCITPIRQGHCWSDAIWGVHDAGVPGAQRGQSRSQDGMTYT
jgi:hypothetical protein